MKIVLTGASHPGSVRDLNEDALLVGGNVAAVADGVGGRQAGEIASRTALGPFAELNGTAFDDIDAAARALCDAVESAHRAVTQAAVRSAAHKGMSTTLTAIAIHDGSIVLAHVGDSRAYLLRGEDPMRQLTSDHSVVAEMVEAGALHRDEATRHPWRNVITRAVGVGEQLTIDRVDPIDLTPGDRVLLCTDGLTDVVPDDDIARVLRADVADDQVVQTLIDTANERGGRDNVTVVLLHATEDGLAR